MDDVFKYILSDYLSYEDKKNILQVKMHEEFDIAAMLGISLRYDNDFALRYASANDKLHIVEFLVSKGADIHARNDEALILASQNGHIYVVKFLISNGANIHIYNDLPLRLANHSGHLYVTDFLVRKGANVHCLLF